MTTTTTTRQSDEQQTDAAQLSPGIPGHQLSEQELPHSCGPVQTRPRFTLWHAAGVAAAVAALARL